MIAFPMYIATTSHLGTCSVGYLVREPRTLAQGSQCVRTASRSGQVPSGPAPRQFDVGGAEQLDHCGRGVAE